MSESPDEASNLEELKADLKAGLESARRLVGRTRLLLGGDADVGDAEQA